MTACGADRIDGGAGHRRDDRVGDAKAARRPRGALREGLRRRRRPRAVAADVAGEDVEQRRRLGDRPREHAVDHERGCAEVGCGRDAVALRLQPDEAAAGGGDAQRAAAVVAVGDRDHAGGDGGAGAARGAARRALRVPGVAGRPVGERLGHRQDPVLGELGGADDHEAGVAQAGDGAVVVGGDLVAQQARAAASAADPRPRGCS